MRTSRDLSCNATRSPCIAIRGKKRRRGHIVRAAGSLPVAVVAVAFVGTGPHAEIAVGIGAEIPIKAAGAVGASRILRLGNGLAISLAAIGSILHFDDPRGTKG